MLAGLLRTLLAARLLRFTFLAGLLRTLLTSLLGTLLLRALLPCFSAFVWSTLSFVVLAIAATAIFI